MIQFTDIGKHHSSFQALAKFLGGGDTIDYLLVYVCIFIGSTFSGIFIVSNFITVISQMSYVLFYLSFPNSLRGLKSSLMVTLVMIM